MAFVAEAGEPFRGVGWIEALEGTERAYASVRTSAAIPNTPNDESPWEGDPGSTIIVKVGAQCAPLVTNKPTHLEWALTAPGSSVPLGTVQVVALTSGASPQTNFTLRFDSAPTANSVANALRSGTIEIYVLLRRGPANSSAVGDWSADTRGAVTGGAAGGAPTITGRRCRGYLRSRCILASAAQDNDSGFASEPATFAYPDPIHLRSALTADTYVSASVFHKVMSGGVEKRSKLTNATATGNRDAALSAVSGLEARVNDDLAVGASDQRIVLPDASFGGTPSGGATPDYDYTWSATGHAAGTRIDDRTLDIVGALQVDPRITINPHMQVTSQEELPGAANVLETTMDVGTQRLTADLAFLWARALNARGEGIAAASGLQLAYSLPDAGGLLASGNYPTKAAHTVSLQDGEEGWGGPMTWDEPLPGGTWTLTVTATDAAGAQTIVDATENYQLLAVDPRIIVVTGGGNYSDGGHHFVGGKTFIAALAPINAKTKKAVTPDANSAKASLVRLETGTVVAEYFHPTTGWTPIGVNAAHEFNCVQASLINPAWDPRLFIHLFGPGPNAAYYTNADTSTWGTNDILIIGTLEVDGTPYGNYQQIAVVGSFNPHSSKTFDPTGLFS